MSAAGWWGIVGALYTMIGLASALTIGGGFILDSRDYPMRYQTRRAQLVICAMVFVFFVFWPIMWALTWWSEREPRRAGRGR